MMHTSPTLEDFWRAHQVGLDMLLTKPVDLAELERIVRLVFDAIGA
jgi:phosphoketolase